MSAASEECKGQAPQVVGWAALDASMQWTLLISMAGRWVRHDANVRMRARTGGPSRERRRG